MAIQLKIPEKFCNRCGNQYFKKPDQLLGSFRRQQYCEPCAPKVKTENKQRWNASQKMKSVQRHCNDCFEVYTKNREDQELCVKCNRGRGNLGYRFNYWAHPLHCWLSDKPIGV